MPFNCEYGVRIENVELVLKTDDAFIEIAVLVVWKTIGGIHMFVFFGNLKNHTTIIKMRLNWVGKTNFGHI